MSNSSIRQLTYLAEPVAGTIFTFVFLIIVNIFYDNISFITADFAQVLPFYNLTLITGIILHFSRIFIRSKIYKVFTEAVNVILFLVIAYMLWITFPFNTSVIGDKTTWDNIFKFLIIVPPLVAVFGTFVSIMKLISESFKSYN